MSTTRAGSRRHVLKAGLALLTGFLFARPARSQSANDEYRGKVDPALVNYRDAQGPDGHHCGSCANYIAPSHCSLINGEISPGGHCLAYAPKSVPGI